MSIREKGSRAKQILEDDIFQEVVQSTRQGLMAQWHLTDYNATSERENLYMQSKGLDEVVRGLRSIVDAWTMHDRKQQIESTKKRR